MKVSIAICTYNGEKYLPEQLESFQRQSRLPDEVIVCDDGSKDLTHEILTDFAEKSPFPVKLYYNKQNLGYVQNFGKAMGLCSGDIVILSDQDDVWDINKIKLIEAEFEKSENVGMVYADAEVVDENLRSFGTTMWRCNNFNLEKQELIKRGKPLDVLLRDGFVLGSSMALRAKYLDLILPIPADIYYDHDDWAALLISALAGISLISQPLIKYRQHQLQTSLGMKLRAEAGIKPLVKAGRRINNFDQSISQLTFAMQRLEASKYPVKKALSKIKTAREHLLARSSLPKNVTSRLIKISQQLIAGNYHAYSNGLKSATKDLLVQ